MVIFSNKLIKYFIFFFLYVFCNSAFSQQDYLRQELRLGERFRWSKTVSIISATNYLPQFLLNPLDHWSSSKTVFYIDDLPFDQFPFNFSSLFLLPFNKEKLINNSNLNTYNFPDPSGSVELYDDLTYLDFNMNLTGFVGSETGDPLINFFTKDVLEQTNKNKIPPSGLFTISNRNYLLNAGYYGSYSTGSINDGIISLRDIYYGDKQNKQITFSGQFAFPDRYTKTFSINASLATYYGWDIPPFVSSLIHFESYLYRIHSSVKDIFDNFSIDFVTDGSFNEVHKVNGILPAKFHLSKYSLIPSYLFYIDKIHIKTSASINLNKADNIDISNVPSQKFFKENINKINYEFSISGWYNNKPSDLIADFKFENHFTNRNSVSGSLEYQHRITPKNMISLKAATSASFPNLNDLYGKFIVSDVYDLTKEYMIEGNENLRESRINYLAFKYSYFSYLSVEFFIEEIQNQIKQQTLSSVKAPFTGQILRNALYINDKKKKSVGINIDFLYSSGIVDTKLLFSFNANSEAAYYPRYILNAIVDVPLPINSYLEFLFHYNSKTTWEEFIVDQLNDFYSGTGYNGALRENISLDFSYNQKFNDFYFFEDLIISVDIQNIFNRKNKYLPAGNNFDRTIIFSMQSNF